MTYAIKTADRGEYKIWAFSKKETIRIFNKEGYIVTAKKVYRISV